MLDLYRYTDIEILAYTEKTNNRVTILCRAVINVFKYCRDGQTERETSAWRCMAVTNAILPPDPTSVQSHSNECIVSEYSSPSAWLNFSL